MTPRHLQGRTLTTLLLTGLLWSCGGSGEGTPTPPTPGTLAVALGSASATVEGAGSATAAVTITRGGSFAGAVALSAEGAPAGVTATLTPASLAGSMTASALNLAVAASTAPGTYPIGVRATGTGVTAATASFSLTVTAPPVPDFAVSVSPGSVTVPQGQDGTAAATISRLDGFTGEVALSVSGVPQNVQVSVAPASTAGTAATISISVPLGVPAASYPLVLNATDSASRTRTAAFTLVVAPQPTLGSIALNPSSITVVQGQQSAPITVTIARAAGVTGEAQLTLESPPSFVTGSFTPNPTSTAVSTLLLDVGLNRPPGTVTVRVRATIGSLETTAELLLTTTEFAPPDFALALDPSAATVTAGGSTSSSVRITRTGNFAGEVAMSVSGVPFGVTATVAPSPTSGDSASLDISTTADAVQGVYPLVVSGTGSGLTGARSTSFTLTVNPPASGGNVQWRFCEMSRFPLWFGVRSGTTGAWTQVTPGANNTYAFPFAQSGQVAYVLNDAGGFDMEIFNLTPVDAMRQAANECVQQPALKTVTGSVTNVLAGRSSLISMADDATIITDPVSTFTLDRVHDGPNDLVAMMGGRIGAVFSQFNRLVVRRNINPADGAVLPVIDFTGPESFPTASSNSNFANVGADQFIVVQSLRTSNGTSGVYYSDAPSAAPARILWGLPPSARAAGDLHVLSANTTNPASPRQIIRYSTDVSPGTSTFGPLLSVPTVTVLGNSPVRIRSEGVWQPEYGSGASASFVQLGAAPNLRTLFINASREFFGASPGYTFEIPDFTGAPGWNPIWMLQPGVVTRQLVSAIGLSQPFTAQEPVDGLVLLTGQRIGTVTP